MILPATARDDNRLRRAFEELERAMDRYCGEARLAT
jgi:hypothetical protein